MSTPESAGHLSAEDLDAYASGEAADSVAVAHVASCPDCAAAVEALRAVSAALLAESSAAPAEMPAGLARSINDALALEATNLRSPTVTTVPSLEAARERRRLHSGWLAGGVAASAAALLVAAIAIAGRGHKPTGQESASGMAKGRPLVATHSGRDYSEKSLSSAVRSLLSGEAVGATPAASAAAAPKGFSGVNRMSSDAASSAGGRSGGRPVVGALPPEPTVVLADSVGCLAALTGDRSVAPLALDQGLWHGKPAFVVVVSDGTKRVFAYVVSPACSAGDQHVLYAVRLTAAS